MQWREPLELLVGNRRFAALWISDLVATIGDRVHRVALAALVYELTGSMTVAGLAFLASGLPDLVLGPLAGVVVDRVDRRRVMIASDLARVVPVMLLPIAGEYWIGSLYVLLFLINAAAILHRPAKMAAIPAVVPQGQLTRANSLSSLAESLGDIGGYPLAGLVVGGLVALLGSDRGLVFAFAVAALGYVLSAAVLWPLRLPPQPHVEKRSTALVWRELVDGVNYLFRNVLLRTNTMLVALGAIAIGMAMPLLVGYAYGVSAQGEVAYSLLNFGIGVGSVAGALLTGVLNTRRLGTLVLSGLVLMGAGLAGLGVGPPLWVAVLLTGLTGFGNLLFLVPSVTIVQRITPASLMGRVFALRSTLLFTALIVANGIGGWLGDQLGADRAFLAIGSLLVVASLVAAAIPVTLLADRLDEWTLEPSG
ncbi:MFS transporter [Thermomicrobium sp. 4228-Ro]|uniref:MFS transporter n=1 Tax=Thermomicrobium sp. 4228-Ro TaxID=2993937 RepID=UPI0022496297|nr:MFS transporter [Thermomicrobium sp. 4228-Ro]MCX2726710.1 MFS transporter [Thermomicrobium sp. 4228-Ro]